MTAFVDGKTAYSVAPYDTGEGWIVVAVNSETQGYCPMRNLRTIHVTEKEAQSVADKLNAQMGVSKLEAQAVHICSMFRPGEYDAVLEFLSAKFSVDLVR